MTYTPDTPLEALAGIGPKKAQAFQKLGVATLRDLAGLYPRRYEDRTQFRTIADAQPGEAVCIRAAVAAEPRAQYVRSGLTLVKVRIVDDTGALDATYFNQPYRKNSLHAGETYIFYGKVEANGFRKTMTNPVCEQAARDGDTFVGLRIGDVGLHRRRVRRRHPQYARGCDLRSADRFRPQLQQVQGGARHGVARLRRIRSYGRRTGGMVRAAARRRGGAPSRQPHGQGLYRAQSGCYGNYSAQHFQCIVGVPDENNGGIIDPAILLRDITYLW